MSDKPLYRLQSLDRHIALAEQEILEATETRAPQAVVDQLNQKLAGLMLERRRLCKDAARRAIPAVIAHFERGSKTN